MITDKASDAAATAWQGTADALGHAGQEIKSHAQQQGERVVEWLDNHLPSDLSTKPAELMARPAELLARVQPSALRDTMSPRPRRGRRWLALGGLLALGAGAVAWWRTRAGSPQDAPLVGQLGDLSRTAEPVHPSAVPQQADTAAPWGSEGL